jgi:hypothetical protein
MPQLVSRLAYNGDVARWAAVCSTQNRLFQVGNILQTPYDLVMRYLAIFLSVILFAGCESTDDSYVPGRVPKETAIAIASRANKQYPYPLSKVTRASWRPEQGYWAIDFKDADEEYGKFYLVSGKGQIVGSGRIEGDRYY